MFLFWKVSLSDGKQISKKIWSHYSKNKFLPVNHMFIRHGELLPIIYITLNDFELENLCGAIDRTVSRINVKWP